MSDQATPQSRQPDDAWWHTVYAGPSGTLPDTPLAGPGTGSVDDWFDSAAGLLAEAEEPGRAAAAEVAPGEEVEEVQPAEPTVDEWFDMAARLFDPAGVGESGRRPGDDGRHHTRAGAEPSALPTRVRTTRRPVPPASGPDEHPDEHPQPPGGAAPEQADDAPPPGPAVKSGEPAAAGAGSRGGGPGVANAEVRDAAVREELPGAVAGAGEGSPAGVTGLADAEVRRATLAEKSAGAEEGEGSPADGTGSAHAGLRPEAAADEVPGGRVDAEGPPSDPADAEAAQPVRPLRRPRDRAAAAAVPHVGVRPPTYAPEPTAVPPGDPEVFRIPIPDTVVDGAQYGNATLRAVSVRGDSARYRGEPRRDALLLTRFGDGADGLLLAVLATPGRGVAAAHGAAAAAQAARKLAAAVGRSRAELSADLREGARDRLRYGLQRLTARAVAELRSVAEVAGVAEIAGAADVAEAPEPADTRAEPGPAPSVPRQCVPQPSEAVPGAVHCLLVSLDSAATHRAAFGIGPGGLYLLRSDHWIDAYAARLMHQPDGQPPVQPPPAEPLPPFRFRLVPATPGDILLLCTPGLAEPIAEEPAVARFLADHWAHPHPPGTVDFLRQIQVRVKGYADDRTVAALWTS